MPIEIERRFIVLNDDWKTLPDKTLTLEQGYFSAAEDYCLRVRIVNDSQAFLTIKGNQKHLLKRPEFEYEIPLDHARELLKLFCQNRTVSKERHVLIYGGMTWEIDVFHGRHAPLVIAEVELQSPDQHIELPPWLGKELTDDIRFSNQYLALHGLPELIQA